MLEGGASKEKVAEGFKIILSDPKVKAILVNIFGGIMNCETLAAGIIEAAKDQLIAVPLVVRLEGTNVDQGKALLKESGLNILTVNSLTDAAKKVVEMSQRGELAMSILINRHTKIITQGITGKAGRFHTEQGMAYAPTYVGGVTPGKGGGEILGIAYFRYCAGSKRSNAMQCLFNFCPAPFAAEAILEAEEAGIELIVCITEGIPMRDMLKVSRSCEQAEQAA